MISDVITVVASGGQEFKFEIDVDEGYPVDGAVNISKAEGKAALGSLIIHSDQLDDVIEALQAAKAKLEGKTGT